MTANALEEVAARLGPRFTRSRSDRDLHGRDPGHSEPIAPDAVAYPETTEEVAALVRACVASRTPIIPYGVGTSLERHVAAPHGGVCLDLSRMTRVIEVNAEDMDVRVEAGVTREQLNAHVRDMGLFFPIDPGANATLGGMAATRASGTNAVRYGTMRANVMGLTVVTAAGEVLRTGSRARKSSAGYDLTALFVGSEGTLGVITEVALRVHPIPERIAAAVVSAPDLAAAVESVIAILQLGVPVARIELLDALQAQACNRRSGLGLKEAPTLFLEFHGPPASVDEQVALVREVLDGAGCSGFAWADQPEDRTRLWRARHEAFWAAQDLRPGRAVLTTDVCVPISRLAEAIMATHADFQARGLTAPILGHVGDGNFHALILYDREDAAERANAFAANEALVARALALGGTCTGEHGVGAGKRAFLLQEHGELAVETMRALKTALDPCGLMNPGKIFF